MVGIIDFSRYFYVKSQRHQGNNNLDAFCVLFGAVDLNRFLVICIYINIAS